MFLILFVMLPMDNFTDYVKYNRLDKKTYKK